MNRSEWLEARQKGITGTDASAILGLNPYMTNQECFDLKMGYKQPEDISKKPCVVYGQEAEAPLRELFKLDHPCYIVEHKEYDLRVNKEYPFLIGSIDGELTDILTDAKGVLEIKTTNILKSMQFEKWNDKVPENYFCQVLHYLLVTGFDFAILKAQLKSEWSKGEVRVQTRHYEFKRSELQKDLDFLKEKEVYFWTENIQKNKRPALILPEI
jgi:putative phage-type endonuclease